MKTASDYREQAAKARDLAKAAHDDRMREIIERMARTWDELAADRERFVRDASQDSH